uniref:Uncharacterized protein n=1 Tax=Arundo donax TaxID=35708 RepID=A0A0A9B9S6_ARUDO
MGLPCCIKTTPKPLLQASVSIVNGREKFGSVKIGAVIMAVLS